MTNARFLQIHTLHNYAAALLNRDDSGLAKRLPYGGVIRTRISSQCLKRHWRMAEDDPHALLKIDGTEAAFRSREIVTKLVLEPLRNTYGKELVEALDSPFQKAVYGEDKGDKQDSRQPLLLGEPEIKWLVDQSRFIAETANGNPATAKIAAEEWKKLYKNNTKTMRENTALPGGLASALFGRMVTSDVEANIDAAIHVAHAFTVHAEESEDDYFTVVDDLPNPEKTGADHIGETELNSGIFYGYVVVDVPALIANLGGDSEMAAKIIHNLLYLIAEVSPGAKLGATAPYSRAAFMLVEAGDRQPRSLAESFHKPVEPSTHDAVVALDGQLKNLDEAYATGEARRCLYVGNGVLTSAASCNMADLANWAAGLVRDQGVDQ